MNAGTRLGPYEVISRIGAGGMGEVWRANDTRLGRAVAVKVLPAEFGENLQLRTRFEREARTISQLNHPHICTLFDVGENYLVMELLEGESLAERLARGPLAVSEALRYGMQIADALDKAHRQGVVHRDLKPGNVMITRGGAKLLDFGLAKSAVLQVSADGATEHRPLTQEGTILGTFQYMSPEQLEGQNVDHRSDIFALGTLLYEMLTARRAFEGKTKTSLIAAIVSADPPPLAQLQPLAPPALDHVIRKCLAKDPEDRWQSAHDIAEELRWISEVGSQAGVAAAATASRRLRRSSIVGAAVVGWLAAVAAGVGLWRLTKRVEIAERPLRAAIAPAEGVRFAAVQQGPAVLSPDGRFLALVAMEKGPGELHVRDLATGTTRKIDGTVGALYPFWSPDGDSIGFFASGKLKIVAAAGGGVQDIAEAPAGRGGTWSPKGMILFAPDIDSPLMVVPAEGGPVKPVTKLSANQQSHRNPLFLSDGERFLYTIRDDTMVAATIRAGSLRGDLDRVVVEKASNVVVQAGYLVFARGGNLVAQHFDEQNLRVAGSPHVLAQGVEYFNPRDCANFSVSPSGLLVYRNASVRTAQPIWYSPDGKPMGPAAPEGNYRTVNLSRDGKKMLFNRGDGSGTEDLWIADTERGTSTRATFVNAGLVFGALSPDGTTLAASMSHAGVPPIVWTQSALGAGGRREIFRGEDTFMVFAWTPDATALVGTTQRNRTGFDIAMIDVKTGKLRVLLSGPYDENLPALSPNGRWLAYASNESGKNQVYVTSFPETGAKWQVSVEGGSLPAWTSDGTRIVFAGTSPSTFDLAGGLFAVKVRDTPAGPEFDPPQRLPIELENVTARAIAPDGRILLLQVKATAGSYQVVTNWTRTLEQ